MALTQIYVSYEVSREIVHALGDLGCVHFRDLNAQVNDFQRAFVDPIRVINNGLRQIRLLNGYMSENGIVPPPVWEGEQFSDLESLYPRLTQLEEQLGALVESQQELKQSQYKLLETRYSLQYAQKFFRGQGSAHASADVVVGVIPRASIASLRQILWRALRGNLVFLYEDIPEPVFDGKHQKFVDKSVFFIVTHGEQLVDKSESIAKAMDAHVYEIPSTDISQQLHTLNQQIAEVKEVLDQTQSTLYSQLSITSQDVEHWKLALVKEKGVYETLNKFVYDENRKLLIAEGWIPTDEIIKVQQTLKHVSESFQVESPFVLNVLHTTKQPPTYHRTNKVTEAFQNMVDVYAVGSYQEVNPALPTVVTFPFMFAIMFGDIGHGFLMFLAAFLVVLNEKKLARFKGGDVFDMFYSGRYVILLMGLFSMFTGFMYNDLFSRSMTLFKSGWEWPAFKEGTQVIAEPTGSIYPFGMDYMWHGAENNLRFMNSYKMKLSVIMGYVHMLYSYFFSLVNDLHFHSTVDLLANFVPGLVFFLSIFGYLSITIIYKWTVDWVAINKQPPSLMNMLINMFLSPGNIDEPLYSGQKTVQLVLLFCALGSVPILLLAKPLYMRKKMQEHGAVELPVNGEEEQEHEESFGDIMIEQAIETIEFCLNSVSHTASYLRLWALSLAHSQLSQVLWDMTLRLSFGVHGTVGVIMTVVMFAVWFSLTIAILTVMEGTSAMLHALRLHWVESMSKFYIGEGYAFEPFTFKGIEDTL